MTKHERIAELARQFAGAGVDPRYAGFFALFNAQKFYEAHDLLEDLWLPDRRGANGNFYRGLIQLAGAFVHLQKHRLRPAAALFAPVLGHDPFNARRQTHSRCLRDPATQWCGGRPM